MRIACWIGIALVIALAGCKTPSPAADTPSSDQRMPASETRTNASTSDTQRAVSPVVLAIYLPALFSNARFYLKGQWYEPGTALVSSTEAVTQELFPNSFLLKTNDTRPFSALLDIHPLWRWEGYRLHLTMHYRVLGKDNVVLMDSSETADSGATPGSNDVYYRVANAVVAKVDAAVYDKLSASSASLPATLDLKSFSPAAIANHDKPVTTGSGFLTNTRGDVVTAAHVLHECELVEVHRGDKTLTGHVLADSKLLDIAVLSTGEAADKPLPLRASGGPQLGEPVVEVGYPLSQILASGPNLTRGNVSALKGMSGSYGLFQFSAPIQPGSSGGPVVSNAGELLGISDSVINAAGLGQANVQTENLNFAVDGQLIAKFLKNNQIPYQTLAAGSPSSEQTGNQAAILATVSIGCYQ